MRKEIEISYKLTDTRIVSVHNEAPLERVGEAGGDAGLQAPFKGLSKLLTERVQVLRVQGGGGFCKASRHFCHLLGGACTLLSSHSSLLVPIGASGKGPGAELTEQGPNRYGTDQRDTRNSKGSLGVSK